MLTYFVSQPVLVCVVWGFVTPLITSLYLALTPCNQEKHISCIYSFMSVSCFLAAVSVSILHYSQGIHADEYLGRVYSDGSYHFDIYIYLNHMSHLYALLASGIVLVTAKFSRYYMHREMGYRRFFSLTALMLAGAMIMAYAGNMEFFFVGWEFTGIASFMLIGFYRHKTQAARSAFTVFTVYRLCDVGLLLGTMLGHILLEKRDRFYLLYQMTDSFISQVKPEHYSLVPLLAALLILASIGKSAQIPFMNWLPKAFEGPTPSSAVFYGALSIHGGLLLLDRTEILWRDVSGAALAIALIGLMSALLATMIGRTVANIKGQLAYAAITQVGIMFVELALGFKQLMYIHFLLHAVLRCYQILVSPSVVAQKLRLLSYNVKDTSLIDSDFLLKKYPYIATCAKKLYIFTLFDFLLWPSMHLLGPYVLRMSRRITDKMMSQIAYSSFLLWILSTLGYVLRIYAKDIYILSSIVLHTCIALTLIKGRQKVAQYWNKVLMYFVINATVLIIVLYEHYLVSSLIYLSIIVFSLVAGTLLNRSYNALYLNDHHGMAQSKNVLANMMLLLVLLLLATPISPMFIFEDLLLNELFKRGHYLALFSVLSFSIFSISLGRYYMRIFWGHYAPCNS